MCLDVVYTELAEALLHAWHERQWVARRERTRRANREAQAS